MKRRSSLLALALLVLLTVIGFFQLPNSPTSPDPASKFDTTTGTPTIGSHASIDSPASSTGDRESGELGNRPASQDNLHGEFTGQVFVRGSGETRRPARMGAMFFNVWRQHTLIGSEKRVEIEPDGRWSMSIEPGCVVQPLKYRSQFGRRAGFDGIWLDSIREQECIITADWLAGPTLNVIDSTTRLPLADVIVTCDDGGSGVGDVTRPFPSDSPYSDRTTKGTSPVQLPCYEQRTEAWITCDGYSPRRISMIGCSGTRTVTLDRGGSVVVNVDKGGVTKRLGVKIWSTHGKEPTLLRSIRVPDRPEFEVEGIPLDDVKFALVVWQAQDEVGPLDFAVPTPVPGVTGVRRVSLCADCPSATEKKGELSVEATLSGDIRLQRVRLVPELTSEFDPLAFDTARTAPVGQIQSISISGLWPGRYLLDTTPSTDLQHLEIRPGQRTTVQAVVLPVADLSIEVRDARDGKSRADARVLVRRRGVVDPGGWTPVEFDASSSVHTTAVPPGLYEVAVTVTGLPSKKLTAEVAGHGARVSVEMDAPVQVAFSMVAIEGDANAVLPALFWSRSIIEPISPIDGRYILGPKIQQDRESGRETVEFIVSPAGRYRVRFPELGGYKKVEAIEVELTGPTNPVVELRVEPH